MIAALLLFLAARPAALRAPLVRVRPGASACTREGPGGVIVDVQGELVLLAVVDAADPAELIGLWVRRDGLCDLADHELHPRLAGRPIEDLRGELRRLPQPSGLDAPTGRFFRLGRYAYEARGPVVIGALVCVAACLPLAMTVHGALSSSGFVPDGEAMRVESELQERFHLPATEVTVLVRAPQEVVASRVEQLTPQLLKVDGVHSIGALEPSPDGAATLLRVGLRTTDDTVTRGSITALRSTLEQGGLRDIDMAGRSVFAKDVEQQMQRDLLRAEMIGLPLALLVLVIVFGTLPAAALPIVVGSLSVVVTLAIAHLVGLAGDLSVFVVSIATLLGFGLGIDYSLIAVSRFRAELAKGRSVEAATVITTTQAGRAIVFSGIAVLLGMAGMFAVPLGVMRSIAVGGVIVVAVTVVMAVVVLPAMLALLGHRIESLAIRRPRSESAAAGDGWRRLTTAVMRRPGIVVTGVVAVSLLASLPAQDAKLEVPMPSALPRSVESRVAQRGIEEAFSQKVASPMLVVAQSADRAQLDAVAERLRSVDNVDQVQERHTADGRTLFTVTTAEDRQGGSRARETVTRIRALDDGGALPALDVGGQFAWEQEFFAMMRSTMPSVLAIVFGSAFVVLLVAFRSIVVPIKAILLNLISITATLGIVVLVFQHGWGASLLGTSELGWVDASLPIVLFCLLFGLSMDYEVFMLASIAEGWQDGLDTTEATADGIARTAPLVTGAALILVVLGVAFASTELVLVKQIGFGIAVALLLDATIVRALLVPGTMKLLGERNWWLPDWLARRLPVARWA